MNTSTSGCIGKYISPVKMYNKICNSLIYVKIKIIGKYTMESRDVLKIHGKLRRYCTSSVERSETRDTMDLLKGKGAIISTKCLLLSFIGLNEWFGLHY